MKYIAICVVAFGCLLATFADAKVVKHRRLLKPSEVKRIYNGTAVQDGGAPHQVGVYQNGTLVCGGSFISENAVLTAAHCIFAHENTPSFYTIQYGSLALNNGTSVQVNSITRHPQFSIIYDDYDIAILHLATAFSAGQNAAIISLASSTPDAGSYVSITGWGWLGIDSTVPSEHLQQADTLQVLSFEDCELNWSGEFVMTDRLLCVYSKQQTSFPGDLGGPMVYNGQLVGVGSFVFIQFYEDENTELQLAFMNGYVKVEGVKDWIEANKNSAIASVTSGLMTAICLLLHCIFTFSKH